MGFCLHGRPVKRGKKAEGKCAGFSDWEEKNMFARPQPFSAPLRGFFLLHFPVSRLQHPHTFAHRPSAPRPPPSRPSRSSRSPTTRRTSPRTRCVSQGALDQSLSFHLVKRALRLYAGVVDRFWDAVGHSSATIDDYPVYLKWPLSPMRNLTPFPCTYGVAHAIRRFS